MAGYTVLEEHWAILAVPWSYLWNIIKCRCLGPAPGSFNPGSLQWSPALGVSVKVHWWFWCVVKAKIHAHLVGRGRYYSALPTCSHGGMERAIPSALCWTLTTHREVLLQELSSIGQRDLPHPWSCPFFFTVSLHLMTGQWEERTTKTNSLLL